MTQAILRLRKLLSSVVPIKRCNLHIILSLKNLQIILSDLSNTGITDKSSGLFGSIERRYFVKLINDHSFRINGLTPTRNFVLKLKPRYILWKILIMN